MKVFAVLSILVSTHAHSIEIPRCLADYEARTRQLTRQTILRPFIHTLEGVAATASLAWAGSLIGELSESKTTGAIIGSSWGITVGVYGTLITLVGREALVIHQLIDHYRAQRLIEEAYTTSGKITEKFFLKLEKRGVTVNRPIDEMIRELDRSGKLCNGELRGNSPDSKLKKRVIGFRRLLKLFSDGKYTEHLKEQVSLTHSTTQSSLHSEEETALRSLQEAE